MYIYIYIYIYVCIYIYIYIGKSRHSLQQRHCNLRAWQPTKKLLEPRMGVTHRYRDRYSPYGDFTTIPQTTCSTTTH